jgi:hypothetical protein
MKFIKHLEPIMTQSFRLLFDIRTMQEGMSETCVKTRAFLLFETTKRVVMEAVAS